VKTLVTGGTGFVGLNVAEELLRRGERVVILGDGDLPAYARRKLSALPGLLETVRADVADRKVIDAVFAEHRPQYVVHAAVITSGEQRELTDFGRIVDVNLKGTAHILSAAAEHAVRRVVYVSSGSAYGLALFDTDAVSEGTPPQPDTLYAITKYASEKLCARYRTLRGLDVVCTRLGSVFGPWEHDTGVRDTLSLPFQIVRLAFASDEVILPEYEPRRDWIYSRDAASGIACILRLPKTGYDIYNLSSGTRWCRLAEKCCAQLRTLFPTLAYRVSTGSERPNIGFLGSRHRAMMSIERLRSDTGFQPAFDDSNVFGDYLTWLRENQGFYESEGVGAWRK
jgi:nucleoside-diphosphate-sugar epimerase